MIRGFWNAAEKNPDLVQDFVRHFTTASAKLKEAPEGTEASAEALASLDRCVRQIFEQVPGIAPGNTCFHMKYNL